MLEVGLTGGIASGKSTVAAIFQELGAHLVDTDLLAREAVAPGGPALAAIRAEFGEGVFGADGDLDRRRLREVIFSDASARARLNAIVHPQVARLTDQALERLRRDDPGGVVLVDVPLLFEAGWDQRFPTVVVVYCPAAGQAARLMERDQVDKDAARQALRAQMDMELKRKKAQFVVDNSGSLEETRRQVKAIWRELCAIAAQDSQPD